MENKILEIIAEILKLDISEITKRINDKTVWDSLSRVEILFAIEEEYDISFSENELKEIDTPQKLVQAALEMVE